MFHTCHAGLSEDLFTTRARRHKEIEADIKSVDKRPECNQYRRKQVFYHCIKGHSNRGEVSGSDERT